MAKNTVNKYVWLAETIHKAKKISFEEINRRWMDNDMSEGEPLSVRTFHKWRIAIEEMMDAKVNLKVFVKVRKDWRDNAGILRNLGYDPKQIR